MDCGFDIGDYRLVLGLESRWAIGIENWDMDGGLGLGLETGFADSY